MISQLTDEQLKRIKDEFSVLGHPNITTEALDIHYILSKITILDIVKKIESFRKIDLKNISDNDLFSALINTISVNIDGLQRSLLFPRFATYPAHTRFYRVRKISFEVTNILSKTISKEQDVWNPPTEYVTRPGRLNKVHESLLYTSPISPIVAIEEMKIEDDEEFGLIVYESNNPIKVVMIGLWEDIPDLTEEENLKMRMYTDFLHTEFARDVGIGTEYLYRVSEMIAKSYFDFPPRDVQDAWCYPSVVSRKQVNVCFRPELAREMLEFVGVQFCKMRKFDNGVEIKCNYIAAGFDINKQLMYFPVNSDLCRKIFPEINID